jgi:hypothetical protein
MVGGPGGTYVGDGEDVAVFEGVCVSVPDTEDVAVGVTVSLPLGVGDTVSLPLGVGDTEGVKEGVCEEEGEPEDVMEGVREMEGVRDVEGGVGRLVYTVVPAAPGEQDGFGLPPPPMSILGFIVAGIPTAPGTARSTVPPPPLPPQSNCPGLGELPR